MKAGFDIAALDTPLKRAEALLEEVRHRGKECDTERALALIEAGVELEYRFRSSTALNWAAFNDHPSIARALAGKGADLEARDGNNRTPLDWAMQYNHGDVVTVIMDAHEAREKAAAEAADRAREAFEKWRDSGMPLQGKISAMAPMKFRR